MRRPECVLCMGVVPGSSVAARAMGFMPQFAEMSAPDLDVVLQTRRFVESFVVLPGRHIVALVQPVVLLPLRFSCLLWDSLDSCRGFLLISISVGRTKLL